MRFWLGLLLIAGLGYQLFFRYERWPDHEHPGSFFERDNLTGKVQTLKPGQKSGNWLADFWGNGGDISQNSNNVSVDSQYFDPYDAQEKPRAEQAPKALKRVNEHLLEDSERIISERRGPEKPPVPRAKRDLVASSEHPPVPMAMLAADIDDVNGDTTPPFAVRQVDLNQDGVAEEIIQNAVQPDGLLDISIVKNGREIFFGRGKHIRLLSTRTTEGWEDIGIKSAQGDVRVYRYNPKEAAYLAVKE